MSYIFPVNGVFSISMLFYCFEFAVHITKGTPNLPRQYVHHSLPACVFAEISVVYLQLQLIRPSDQMAQVMCALIRV